MLSADEMALFREMAAAYRKYGMRVSVTGAPLTIDRPGRFQGQVVGIDPTGLGPSYFFAQLTSGSSPYSWVERVETAAGTWANGARSGTTNAYQVQPSSGTPSTPATNDIVVMRVSGTVGGVYEFVLADKLITNALSFNTGTRVLTSTVSGVPATATIPAGSASLSSAETKLTASTTVVNTTATTLLTLSMPAGSTWLVSYNVLAQYNSGDTQVEVWVDDGGGSSLARSESFLFGGSPTFLPVNMSCGGVFVNTSASTVRLRSQGTSSGFLALGDATDRRTWISAVGVA